MKRIALFALIGFILGLFNSIFTLKLDSIDSIAYQIVFVITVGAVLATLTFIFDSLKLKKEFNNDYTGEEADERDLRINRLYANASLANVVVLTLSITALCIFVINGLPIWLALILGVLLVISIIGTVILNKFTKKIYEGQSIPDWHDKNYAKALFKAFDEGERYIALDSLYKAYTLMNILLPLILVALMFYSEATGNSQIFAILLISASAIAFNARYLLSVRAQYK